MKRILSLTLCVALVALIAGATFARPVIKGERAKPQYLSSSAAIQENATARDDTLFLFAASGPGAKGAPGTSERFYTFDDGAGGPATAGFTLFDVTAQDFLYWHLQDLTLSNGHATDFQYAGDFGGDGINDFAWWCGAAGMCGWTSDTGYGGNWEQYLELDLPAGWTTVDLSFEYLSDFEGDVYDYFNFLIEEDGEWLSATGEELYLNQTSGPQDSILVVLAVAAADYTGAVEDMAFHFTSDGGWSDQDGSYISDYGAVWIDNVTLSVDGVQQFAYDFEDGIEANYPEFIPSAPSGAGTYGQLYANLFNEDICVANSSYAWAFFDLQFSNPEYPIPVVPYGPPSGLSQFVDNGIQSPVLGQAHMPGDAVGVTVASIVGPSTAFYLDYWVYMDMPLNSLIFQRWVVSAETIEIPCLGGWANDNYVYYGDDKVWIPTSRDVTLYVAESAMGNTITGLSFRLSCTDMCGPWCNIYGDGTGHTPAPYFDNVGMKAINASAVAWGYRGVELFQDSFLKNGDNTMRIDCALDVQPATSTTLVIGDSTRYELNMDLLGGIAPSAYMPNRPANYMYWRCVAGPNMGVNNNMFTSDPDDTDGCYSPLVGIDTVNGDVWNVVQADTARYQGTYSPGSWAADFADDFFLAGDVIHLYFKATSVNPVVTECMPEWAESSDPLLRDGAHYTVRCLPTTGAQLLFVEDSGVGAYWREAFLYNGYSGYDTYTTQGPSSGLHNGVGGRAVLGDLGQYHVIAWDSGNLPSYTITNALPADITFDDVILDDWLVNSTHDVCGWFMGCEIANDLDDEPSFLQVDMGGNHILDGTYYDDVTGVLVPKVYATHAALQIGGLSPYFWVDGGCPSIENFDMVAVLGALAVTSHIWEDDGGTLAKAGIYNSDPDGNGTDVSGGGYTNRTLFNPFSYFQARDAGFGLGSFDYARRMVGDVLFNLCGFINDVPPTDSGTVPAKTALAGNFPNPFNPTTNIKFSLSTPEIVHLTVYDLSGRAVTTLVNGPLAAAHHTIEWNGMDDNGKRVASGVYFYKLTAGDYSATDKMVMLK